MSEDLTIDGVIEELFLVENKLLQGRIELRHLSEVRQRIDQDIASNHEIQAIDDAKKKQLMETLIKLLREKGSL